MVKPAYPISKYGELCEKAAEVRKLVKTHIFGVDASLMEPALVVTVPYAVYSGTYMKQDHVRFDPDPPAEEIAAAIKARQAEFEARHKAEQAA